MIARKRGSRGVSLSDCWAGTSRHMETRQLFQSRRLFSSFHAFKRRRLNRNSAIVFLLAVVSVAGCKEASPPVTDVTKTPWLDPQSQIKGLKDGDYRIRGLSALNLGKMGAKAADAIPELERLSRDDPNERVRENAGQAVEKIRAATTNPK